MKAKNREKLQHAKGVIDALRMTYISNDISMIFSGLAGDIRDILEDEEESEAEECNN